ncbi:MAG: cysteine desulfurase family protein [Candidatus Pacebacteria bacterium]|nr:cysteine desulfurase family protein [Candidatus Paceibacterota bacterium]
MKIQKRIYLDHAAATYMDKRVESAMKPFWSITFGNPSSVYTEGREAKAAVSQARERVARILGCRPDEIIFTGGGTEGDNMAVLGVARHYKKQGHTYRQAGNHVVVSAVEHEAVLNSCEALKKEGFEITFIKPGKDGVINPKDVEAALKPETILVSIMYANNEIGTIQPIPEIARIIGNFRKKKTIGQSLVPGSLGAVLPLFHTDAVQVPLYLDLNVQKLGVDLMTLNGSKIYGPKGSGALYVRRGVKIEPIIYGGGQEMKIRPGTESVAGIIGFSRSLELAAEGRGKEAVRLSVLRDYFIKKITEKIPEIIINGSLEKRLPNNVNISVMGVEGESAVLYLDDKGVSCSTGSACSSDSLEPSHVIKALGVPDEYAHGSLRFSMGKATQKKDMDYVLKVLPEIVERLRSISALDTRAYKIRR